MQARAEGCRDDGVSAEARELRLLEELGRGGHVSQRRLAERVGVSVGLVNRMLRDLLAEGYVRVARDDVKPYAYELTARGVRRQQQLRYSHYGAVAESALKVRRRIEGRLQELRDGGVGRVVFYGAGEVMELTWPLAEAAGLEVVGVVDDDPAIQGQERNGVVVQSPEAIAALVPCAVVITTFRYAEAIRRALDRSLRDTVPVWHL